VAFQPGNNANTKGRKDKPFKDALAMELKAAGDDHKALRKIARKLMEQAEAGDIQAIKELANRLDGMPVQQSEVEVTQRFVAEVPEVIPDSAEWLKQSQKPQTLQ
jgi:hypothetical protein